MAAEIVIGIVAICVTIISALIGVMVKVAIALTKNTTAVDQLIKIMDGQGAKLSELDEAIDDHEGRIVAIETIHRVRGCDGIEG